MFPATLIAMVSGRDELLCAAGLRFAADGFFSECYLDAPVDEVLSALWCEGVGREKIFEVTSLASRSPHIVGSFLRKIVACGKAAGFEWAFFTATTPLKGLLERIGLPLMPLAVADRARVAHPDDWGSYYELSPSVCAVHREATAPARTTLPGLWFMVEFLRVLHDGSRFRGDATAMSDDQGTLSRRELAARVAGMAAELRSSSGHWPARRQWN